VGVNVDGLGPLDWILETVVNLIADLIKDWVADMVEGPLRGVIQVSILICFGRKSFATNVHISLQDSISRPSLLGGDDTTA
jgi:hypothetical protein